MDASLALELLKVIDLLQDEELGRDYRAADWPYIKKDDRSAEISRLSKSFEKVVKVNRVAEEMSPADLQALLSGHIIK